MRISIVAAMLVYSYLWVQVPANQGAGTGAQQPHAQSAATQRLPSKAISFSGGLALSIASNIVSGFLTVFLIDMYRRRRDSRIKNIYGNESEYHFVYGQETLGPVVTKAIERLSQIENWPTGQKDRMIAYPLSKPDWSGEFSADEVACVCEVRGATYLAPFLVKQRGMEVKVVSDSDQEIQSRAGLNMISFGTLNNSQTMLLLNDPSSLVEFNRAMWRFARKGSARALHAASDATHDFGIIVRVRPDHANGKTWIACAGMQETGTAGAAHFLANRWTDIADRTDNRIGFFVAVIRFLQGKDDSGKLLFFAQTVEQLQHAEMEF